MFDITFKKVSFYALHRSIVLYGLARQEFIPKDILQFGNEENSVYNEMAALIRI